jgi:hypothetical protein
MVDVKVVEDISKKMEATIKVILKTTWPTVMESTLIDQLIDMRDSGKIICLMAKDKHFIVIRADTMVSF